MSRNRLALPRSQLSATCLLGISVGPILAAYVPGPSALFQAFTWAFARGEVSWLL